LKEGLMVGQNSQFFTMADSGRALFIAFTIKCTFMCNTFECFCV